MIRAALTTFVLAVVAAGAYAGGKATEGSKERFRALDSNGNGYVSQYEAKDRHRIFWYYQKSDRNGDGHISLEEFERFEQEVPPFEAQK